MPTAFYLLTAFGKDRPGMVAGLARFVYRLKGNVEDASMTRLGGEFGMMLVVGVPNAAAGRQLTEKLRREEKRLGLTLSAKPLASGLAHVRRRTPATHLISVYGIDRPGIVYRAAELLADLHISITDLNTQVLQRKGGPAGKPLYVMLLEVAIPSRPKAAALEHQLRRLGQALRMEITLQRLETVPL